MSERLRARRPRRRSGTRTRSAGRTRVTLGARLLETAVAVGRVTGTSARVWLRTRRAGAHRLVVTSEGPGALPLAVAFEVPRDATIDGTWSVEIGADGRARLVPGTRYRFRVEEGEPGAVLGEGRFETPPPRGAPGAGSLVFGIGSCHQPFDDRGRWDPVALRMLRASDRSLRERGAKFLIMCGDQMYSDKPDRFSLFDEAWFRKVAPPGRASLLDCSPAETRALYQARYRSFWAMPAWLALQANRPTCFVVDDHDVVDNWGSAAEHANPEYASLLAGARAAAHDYQYLRWIARDAGATDFHLSFAWGDAAVFAFDLRSCRATGDAPRVLGDAQWAAFDAFLEANRDAAAICLVSSVPLAFLPPRVATVFARLLPDPNDAADRWSQAAFVGERDRLLARLRRQGEASPRQRIVILSGDVHVGYARALRWKDGVGLPMLELTSSALTNRSSWLQWKAATLLPRLQSSEPVAGCPDLDVSLVPGRAGHARNPLGALNLGLVELRNGPDGCRVKLTLATPHASRDRLDVAFESDWL